MWSTIGRARRRLDRRATRTSVPGPERAPVPEMVARPRRRRHRLRTRRGRTPPRRPPAGIGRHDRATRHAGPDRTCALAPLRPSRRHRDDLASCDGRPRSRTRSRGRSISTGSMRRPRWPFAAPGAPGGSSDRHRLPPVRDAVGQRARGVLPPLRAALRRAATADSRAAELPDLLPDGRRRRPAGEPRATRDAGSTSSVTRPSTTVTRSATTTGSIRSGPATRSGSAAGPRRSKRSAAIS